MFAPFMLNAWIAGTIVAIIAGVVGVFVVMRGSAFLAHAVPHGAFAGAAGATLIGLDPLLGLGVFAAGGAVTIALLGRRARHDVVTALSLVMTLALGALFLSRSREYSSQVFALLFGQILGVSSLAIGPVLVVGILSLVIVGVLFRPLLLTSLVPEMAVARRVSPDAMSLVFALVIVGATTVSVPVVGALLMFALLVGPPAAACLLTRRPAQAVLLSLALTLVTVWSSLAIAYLSDLPLGFFVSAIGALLYAGGRIGARVWRTGRRLRAAGGAVRSAR